MRKTKKKVRPIPKGYPVLTPYLMLRGAAQAIEFYKQGDWDRLIEYCTHDVRITKQLYDLIRKQGFINIPKRYTNELIKVPLNLKEIEIPATLF